MATDSQLGLGNKAKDLIAYKDSSTGRADHVLGANGGMQVYGLARKVVRVSASAYSATEVLGFRLLNKGTGTLTISDIEGGTDVVVTAAELTAMGDAAYEDWPIHCDSVTAGTGMELIVYIPA